MKALTLWNPYAHLVGRSKVHETRSWPTKHRGTLAIHAAACRPYTDFDVRTSDAIARILGSDWRKTLRGGVIVSLVDLVDCIPAWRAPLDPLDQMFGDFGPGRYALTLANVRFLDEPIPVSGRQRLWNVPEDVAAEVLRRVA